MGGSKRSVYYTDDEASALSWSASLATGIWLAGAGQSDKRLSQVLPILSKGWQTWLALLYLQLGMN